jgi:hypothetical protein
VRCIELANSMCSARNITSVGRDLVKDVDPEELELPLGRKDLAMIAQELTEELAKSEGWFVP